MKMRSGSICMLLLVASMLMVSGVEAAELEPVLIQQEAAEVEAAGKDNPAFEYCYFRELVSCGSCSYHTDCLLWYGWSNRFGEECIGRRVEYCDGHPTGLEYPVAELRCGC